MEQKTKDCQSCKKGKMTTQELVMMCIGFTTLALAIYGGIHLIKHLF